MTTFIAIAKQAGIDAVDESGMDAEELLATLRPGHVAWSEDAAGARVHALLGFGELSDEERQEFYRAYDEGAASRIHEIAA